MKDKFIYLLVGAVLVIGLSTLLLNNRLTNLVYSDKTADSATPAQSKVSSPNFDLASRTYTSPVIKGSDGVKRAFTLNLLEDWSVEKELTDDGLYVVFAKSDSRIIINEYYEGFYCVFPEYENRGESGYVNLEHYKYIATNFGEYRVGKGFNKYNQSLDNYFCENVGSASPFSDSPWRSGTKIGLISYSVKAKSLEDYDSVGVQEIENAIETIKLTRIND